MRCCNRTAPTLRRRLSPTPVYSCRLLHGSLRALGFARQSHCPDIIFPYTLTETQSSSIYSRPFVVHLHRIISLLFGLFVCAASLQGQSFSVTPNTVAITALPGMNHVPLQVPITSSPANY